jgi:hypothetical protein
MSGEAQKPVAWLRDPIGRVKGRLTADPEHAAFWKLHGVSVIDLYPASALTAAREEGRRQGLEQAAQTLERHAKAYRERGERSSSPLISAFFEKRWVHALEDAAAIRALTPSAPERDAEVARLREVARQVAAYLGGLSVVLEKTKHLKHNGPLCMEYSDQLCAALAASTSNKQGEGA